MKRYSDSLLPALYDIFGDKLVDLIVVFGGMTIKFPSMGEMSVLIEDVDIFNTLTNTTNFYRDLQILRKKYCDDGAKRNEYVLERFDLTVKELKQMPRKCKVCGKAAKFGVLTCGGALCTRKSIKLVKAGSINV